MRSEHPILRDTVDTWNHKNDEKNDDSVGSVTTSETLFGGPRGVYPNKRFRIVAEKGTEPISLQLHPMKHHLMKPDFTR